jgi:SpoVK/Ycf46/Vps4 family AAA+-type ATPase
MLAGDVNIDALAEATRGFSGADIQVINLTGQSQARRRF